MTQAFHRRLRLATAKIDHARPVDYASPAMPASILSLPSPRPPDEISTLELILISITTGIVAWDRIKRAWNRADAMRQGA